MIRVKCAREQDVPASVKLLEEAKKVLENIGMLARLREQKAKEELTAAVKCDQRKPLASRILQASNNACSFYCG